MKRILLASASIVAFAGAAAAEVTFGGDAELGYNDDIEDGFYWEANLGVTLSQELNNGLTAAASVLVNIVEDSRGDVVTTEDYVLSLTAESGGLFFGDTEYAAITHWDPAGEMENDDFSEEDGETVLRGDFSYFGVEASVSYNIADGEGDLVSDSFDNQALDQLSIGASGAISRFTFTLGYQEESDAVFIDDLDDTTEDDAERVPGYNEDDDDDFDGDEVIGVSAGTTFGGADVQVAYASNRTDDAESLGVEATYPFGPVTIGAYYVLENAEDDLGNDQDDGFGVSADYATGPIAVSVFYEFLDEDNFGDGDDDDNDDGDADSGIEASYDLGNGLALYAGYIDSTEGYVGAEYDLGSGSELIISYADQDEEGAREYKEGTTLALTMEF